MTNNEDSLDVEMSFSKTKSKIKKSQCTLGMLETWYKTMYEIEQHDMDMDTDSPSIREKKVLVVIVPDFESFNYSILQDFVLILR